MAVPSSEIVKLKNGAGMIGEGANIANVSITPTPSPLRTPSKSRHMSIVDREDAVTGKQKHILFCVSYLKIIYININGFGLKLKYKIFYKSNYLYEI